MHTLAPRAKGKLAFADPEPGSAAISVEDVARAEMLLKLQLARKLTPVRTLVEECVVLDTESDTSTRRTLEVVPETDLERLTALARDLHRRRVKRQVWRRPNAVHRARRARHIWRRAKRVTVVPVRMSRLRAPLE